MTFRELIDCLRNDKADPRRASDVLKGVGLLFILPSIILLVFGVLGGVPASGFAYYVYGQEIPGLLLVLPFILGLLWLVSAFGIGGGYLWGKGLCQIVLSSSFLLLVLVVAYQQDLLSSGVYEGLEGDIRIFFYVFQAMASLAFLVSGGIVSYYGIGYLGRLPVGGEVVRRSSAHAYVETPLNLNLGAYAVFPLFLLSFFLSFMVLARFFGGQNLENTIIFMALISIWVLVPVLYNYRRSSFEKNRGLIKSFTGGGLISTVRATTPFFRLLFYEDALEVRVLFYAYLVPYEKMLEAPKQLGGFFGGMLIKSDLPGVPSNIIFYGLNSEDAAHIIEKYREKTGGQTRQRRA